MLVETVVLGSAALATRAAVARHRRRTEAKARETWFRAIQSSQQIQAQTAAARQAMVNEVRRLRRIEQMNNGGEGS
jgi:hypothetical protein